MVQPVLEQLQIHHADNFGWALACCAWQPDVAEDVLQEAYLRVLDGRARYLEKSALRTWFFAVIIMTGNSLGRYLVRMRSHTS